MLALGCQFELALGILQQGQISIFPKILLSGVFLSSLFFYPRTHLAEWLDQNHLVGT